MNRSCIALAAAAFLLSSCDAFVPPTVTCDTITVSAGGTYQERAANTGCVIAQDDIAIITHAPATVETNSDFDQEVPSNQSLAGLKVEVVGAAGYYVCAGDNCQSTLTADNHDTTVTIDDHGALTYTLGSSYEMVLAGGGEYSGSWVAATEVYGPGNSCDVNATVDFKCVAYVAPASTGK